MQVELFKHSAVRHSSILDEQSSASYPAGHVHAYTSDGLPQIPPLWQSYSE